MRNALTNHPKWFQKVQRPASRGLTPWGIVPGQESRFANLVTQWTAAKTQSAVQPSITPTVTAMASSQPEDELDVSIPVGISYNLQVRALNLDSREEGSFSGFYDKNLITRPHDSLSLIEINFKQSAVNGNNHYAAVALSKDPDNVVTCETFLRENPLIESKDTNGSTWKHIPRRTPLRRELQLHNWFEERKIAYERLEIERGATMAVKNTITTDVRCYLYPSKYQETALRIIGEQLELTL